LNVEIEYEILRNEINQTANFPAKYECVQETIVSTHEVPNLSETILKMEAEEVNTLLGVYYYAGVPADGRTPLFVLDEARKATSIIIKSNGTVIAAN